ncbi:unnamed protein product [Phaedon cochleariae]|uniref:Integrin beta n=1 Tax=Phaedon cochleariae TaxID=80249 RepID=A0A9P0DGG2_PHACE|nr:unnamed protein product [Phaedon cochleariae]
MHSTKRENHFKLSRAFLLVIAVIPSLGVELSVDKTCNNTDINDLCSKHETCDACIQAHWCCNFCYEKDYKGQKCNNVFARLSETENKCPEDMLEKNFDSNYTISKNKHFTGTTDFVDKDEIVQIRPQKFEIILRRGEAVNISFTYKPVANYPLELYFLGDLSSSMLPSLEYVKKLGHDLPDTLKTLSKNYKIAYGSFMDKPGMPFYFTDEENFRNPCFATTMGSCEMGYLFKHRLNFTGDTHEFDEKIQDSQVTANVDDLDGALEAILQILVCGKKIGWSENSRKIILLATDSLLHMAGDGILVGAVKRPTEECLLDDNGNHSQPFKYDYPSMEQIVTILRQKKVNIIFAVKTKKKMDYYEAMSRSLVKDYGFVGQLEEESTNILDLIKQGYNNFAEQVSFFVNLTNHEHLEVKFLADCDNTGYNETSTCYGVKNKEINFTAEIRLKDDTIMNDRYSDTIYIEEKNINETIEISISYVGNCKCQGGQKLGLNCSHGRERCGKCSCDSEWTGENCDKPCKGADLHRCRKEENGTISRICSRNGDCICGNCKCSYPYTGTYCEFKCPSIEGKICSGHGNCEDGKCFCRKEYEGESCSCSTATNNCDFDGAICSGQGKCICNQCKCEADFSGKYCELNKKNNTICEVYTSFLADTEKNETTRIKRHGIYDVLPVEKSSIEEIEGQPICEQVLFMGNYRCTHKFSYSKENTTILLPYTKYCTMTASFGGMIGGIITGVLTVLAGLLFIMIHKWRIHRQDQLEYKKFLENQGKFSDAFNPLYLSPITEYENPQSRKNYK